MGKILVAFAAAGLALALAGCGRDVDLDRLASGRSAKVAAVASGDVLTLDGGEQLRLAGIEAPAAGEPYAEDARKALQTLAGGKSVELLFGGARQDPLGRTDAHARTLGDRRWIEGAMLEQGAARVRTFSDNRALAARMLTEEARARIAKRGLWALPRYRVLLPEEVPAEAEGFQIVEGRVRRITQGRGGWIYVDFADDWRGAFGAEIPWDARREFRLAETDPLALEGKLVRIRGSVKPTRNGPRMRLDHPEQVEQLNDHRR